ncbi:AlpA family phage regulatory protein, partial [Klebsiella pneumoniae]
KIGSRAIAFVEREVDEWISQRIEERDAVISTKSQL